MNKSAWIFIAVLACVSFLAAFSAKPDISDDTPVWTVLNKLGKPLPGHAPAQVDQELVQKGMEIVTKGFTTDPQGKQTKRQSKHFLCTHCHNTVLEDPDPKFVDPMARLKHAQRNQLPFLPGTTLYGCANRTTWYNDDYQIKYGSLVIPAKDTLRNAVQVCATECSQGRALEDWEMEAVLQYLWSIQLKVKDLNLPPTQRKQLDNIPTDATARAELLKDIEAFFASKSPAHTMEPLNTDKRKVGEGGNPEDGKYVFEKSCMHCHGPGQATNFELDDNMLDFKFLKNNLDKYTRFSIYNIIRKGTYPQPGYRPYMPYYTKERISDDQIEDLAAYILQQATNAKEQ